MKSANIVKKLKKEGYRIKYKKWGYWDGVPHVQLEGFEFAIAEYTHPQGGWLGVNMDFIFNHVRDALNVAKNNNPILLEKIEAGWDYTRYLILNMGDYYLYKKEKYPYNDEYHRILNK